MFKCSKPTLVCEVKLIQVYSNSVHIIVFTIHVMGLAVTDPTLCFSPLTSCPSPLAFHNTIKKK